MSDLKNRMKVSIDHFNYYIVNFGLKLVNDLIDL